MNEINTVQGKGVFASRRVAASHTKKNKKRLLPDVFYLRWELELLSAFVAILFLLQLPDWILMATHLILDRYGTTMDVGWLITTSDMLVIGFAIYIFLRLMWIYLIRKQRDFTTGGMNFIKKLDEVGELIISVCVIVSVIAFLTFIVHLLVVMLQNEMFTKGANPVDIYPSH
ncbi:MAG: hypothetical protein ABI237_11245 [Ginsengibacter sp.]